MDPDTREVLLSTFWHEIQCLLKDVQTQACKNHTTPVPSCAMFRVRDTPFDRSSEVILIIASCDPIPGRVFAWSAQSQKQFIKNRFVIGDQEHLVLGPGIGERNRLKFPVPKRDDLILDVILGEETSYCRLCRWRKEREIFVIPETC